MEQQLKARTKLRIEATKLCNDIREYRAIGAEQVDLDDLALKIHLLKKVQSELAELQTALEAEGIEEEQSTKLQSTPHSISSVIGIDRLITLVIIPVTVSTVRALYQPSDCVQHYRLC